MRLFLTALLACLSAPLAAQDLIGFDSTDFGSVVLTRKQGFGAPVPEVALGAYNNEPIVTYSPKSVFARMGRSVGRLDVLTDKGVFPCTAFVVAKSTLLTNHHCVPGILDHPVVGATRIEAIQFVAGYTRQGVDADTKRYFVSPEPVESSRDLDYSVLRVIGDPAEDFGTLALAAHDPGDGDPFWIIGHPMGEAQRISREKCRANAPARNKNRLLHTCDTLPGNSGSPVIDASLQAVVALHNAGSERDSVNFAVPMSLILENSAVLTASLRAPGPIAAPQPAKPGPDITSLLDEVAAMGFKLGKEREAREAAQGELSRLQEALDTALKEAGTGDAFRAEAQRLQARLEEVIAREKTREAAIAGLRDALVAAETRAATAAQRLREAEAELAAALASRPVSRDTDRVVADLRRRLAEAEARAAEQTDDTRSLEEKLAAALAARLAAEVSVEDTRDKLAAALAAQKAAEAQLTDRLDEVEQRQILLNEARDKLAQTEERATKADLQVEALNQNVAALRSQLAELQALLDDSRAKDKASEVRLQNLGSELNAAIARVAQEERKRRLAEEAKRKAEEEKRRLEEERAARLEAEKLDLEKYRSEFFGRLRDVIGDREGITISGDRFVFSSEVLFEVGSADLSNAGRQEIEKVAEILLDISRDIPEEFDWVIRVDGHTDNQRIRPGGAFADNWELSQARALSVVRDMIDNYGMPPQRLSANGFGEFQPIDPRNTAGARAANRRIELSLSER
ncbi:peptidoglycan -binding protein [Antarctobacter jejuensis]|uniref:peptidoglycan -binding protein n=1 Tax=Antarctobacter jejuensis TaxID=1439938 RepID=UPI003FD36E1A